MGETHRSQSLELSESLADARFCAYLRKKTERMTTALYFVTDLLPDQEPLKWSLRHKCITLLGELLPHARTAFRSGEKTKVKALVSEITSLLGVAHTARLFSAMNADLLLKACRDLKDLLGEMKDDMQLDPRSFDIEGGKLSLSDSETKKTSYTTSLYDIDIRQPVSDSEKKSGNAGIGEQRDNANIRKQQIISLLQERGSVTSGDIKKIVKGVSDKTLQRDLSVLEEQGIITRSGSRRWTTYSIL